MALNSDILVPADGAEVPAGTLEVCGYAFAGGERSIVRVDVSRDSVELAAGRVVRRASGRGPGSAGATGWRSDAGPLELVARAWDSAASTQPEHPATV